MKCEFTSYCRNYKDRCLFCYKKNQFQEKKSHNHLRKKPKSKGKGLDFEEVVFEKYKNNVIKKNPNKSSKFKTLSKDVKLIKNISKNNIKNGGKKQITLKYEDYKNKFLFYKFTNQNNIYVSAQYNYLLKILYKIKELKLKLNKISLGDYKKRVLGRTPGSGRYTNLPGDIQLIEAILECKSTNINNNKKKKITIKKKYHTRLENEAYRVEKLPFLTFGFKINKKIDKKNIFFSTQDNYLLDVLYQIKFLKKELV